MCEIVSLKHTKNGFYQIRLQEVVIFPGKTSPLAMLNEGNPKFSESKPHNAWLTIELDALKKHFPQLNMDKALSLEKGEEMGLKWSNPEIGGHSLHLQVEEYLLDEGSDKEFEYNSENTPKAAKQIELTFRIAENGRRYNKTGGKEGMRMSYFIIENINDLITQDRGDVAYFVTDGSEPIFRRVKVVFGQPTHSLIPEQILVHFSEVDWAEKIDVSHKNSGETEEERKVAEKLDKRTDSEMSNS